MAVGGLHTATVTLTVKTASSHLIIRKFNAPTHSLRTPYVRVETYPDSYPYPYSWHALIANPPEGRGPESDDKGGWQNGRP
eukprot:6331274-Pyramimonas_sp.AAC.1